MKITVLPVTSTFLQLKIDISFQILHAIHSLEKLLKDFIRRGAVFEIVFWDGMILDIPQQHI